MKKVMLLSLVVFTTIFISCEKQHEVNPSNPSVTSFSKADYLGTWRYTQRVDSLSPVWFPIVITDSSAANYMNVLFPFTNDNHVDLVNVGNWNTVNLPEYSLCCTFNPSMQGTKIKGSIFLNTTKDSLTVMITRKDWNFYERPDTTTFNSPYNDGYHSDRVVCVR